MLEQETTIIVSVENCNAIVENDKIDTEKNLNYFVENKKFDTEECVCGKDNMKIFECD